MENPLPETTPKQVLTLPVAILIAGLVIAGSILYTRDRPTAVAQDSTTNPAKAGKNYGPENLDPVTASDHFLGNPNATVKIIEFSDIECPYCKDFHNVLHEVMDTYGKDGKLVWVYRHFPLLSKHPKALAQAHAAECAGELGGEAMFWSYLDKIFEITPSNNGFDLALLDTTAKNFGLDMTKFKACQDSNKYRPLIEKQLANGIDAGITGTPTSFVITKSGKVYPIGGWISAEALKQIVDLAVADKL